MWSKTYWKIGYRRLKALHGIPVFLIALHLSPLVGCKPNMPSPASIPVLGSPRNPSNIENRDVVDESKARDIGMKFFNRPAGSGVYVEDLGEHFLVAPPIKTRQELEAVAIVIDKATGEVSSRKEISKGTGPNGA